MKLFAPGIQQVGVADADADDRGDSHQKGQIAVDQRPFGANVVHGQDTDGFSVTNNRAADKGVHPKRFRQCPTARAEVTLHFTDVIYEQWFLLVKRNDEHTFGVRIVKSERGASEQVLMLFRIPVPGPKNEACALFVRQQNQPTVIVQAFVQDLDHVPEDFIDVVI